MGRKTQIDWADASWNPVTGCLHGCEYCYARGISRRFGCKLPDKIEDNAFAVLDEPYVSRDGVTNPYPYEFLPTFHRYRLDIPQTWKQPKNIFVCSMADLFGEWVEDDVIREVFDACRKAPWHRYLFLTKNPERYKRLAIKDELPLEDNFWFGSTTTRHNDGAFFTKSSGAKRCHTFVSIEPILERFGKPQNGDSVVTLTDWAIIGAETGSRKGKVIPEKEWILELVEVFHKAGKPVFMKESLRELMGADFMQEFPWEA